ncbi:MAG TPA: MoaD/ThiS family protein [Desulfobacteria bacterium]|nr:MoaD/ThiS family protein [Desulfobacteria bacterium]
MSYVEGQAVTIRIFGFLRSYLDERGLPYVLTEEIPDGGMSAYDLVKRIAIPTDKVEAVFRNGEVINIYDLVSPGDRVALLPHGTPGPYRFFLGMDRENRERARREGKVESP